MSVHRVFQVGWLGFCLATAALAAQQRPMTASPGHPEKLVLISDPCPTFSWSRVDDAKGYELVVYLLGDGSDEAVVALTHSVSGAALSWTPSLESCVERGRKYAWSVRAIAPGRQRRSNWSRPSLFAVTLGPSVAELEKALQVVGQHLDRQSLGTRSTVADLTGPAVMGGNRGTGANAPVADLAGDPGQVASVSAVGEAALTVEGEVREVGLDGAPRLWGRGRPGTKRYGRYLLGLCSHDGVTFGLSAMMTPWWSAADACPAGTWVCLWGEITACNTIRPDTTTDGYNCLGQALNLADDEHVGWVANVSEGTNDTTDGMYRSEDGSGGATGVCRRYPVWCCS